MVDCLAETGFDAGLPFILGIIFVLLGVVVAVIAVRRRSTGAALVLALALVALPLGLGAGAPSASAATSSGCPTAAIDGGADAGSSTGNELLAPETPVTPVCTPVTEDDVVIQSDNASYFGYYNGLGRIVISTADAAAMTGAMQTLLGAHQPLAQPAVDAVVYEYSTQQYLRTVPLTLTPIDVLTAEFPEEQMDDITGSDSDIRIDLRYTISYDDGCGDPTSSSISLPTRWLD